RQSDDEGHGPARHPARHLEWPGRGHGWRTAHRPRAERRDRPRRVRRVVGGNARHRSGRRGQGRQDRRRVRAGPPVLMTAPQETEQGHPIRILALAGSLREASLNRRLVRLATELVPTGVELVSFDGLGAVEPYDGDVEDGAGIPPGAQAFIDAIRNSDGLFIATPEYNGSVPGQLKNALDWASRADGAVAHEGLQGS